MGIFFLKRRQLKKRQGLFCQRLDPLSVIPKIFGAKNNFIPNSSLADLVVRILEEQRHLTSQLRCFGRCGILAIYPDLTGRRLEQAVQVLDQS